MEILACFGDRDRISVRVLWQELSPAVEVVTILGVGVILGILGFGSRLTSVSLGHDALRLDPA